MLIAEDLLLLLTDDRSGRLAGSGTEVDVALGGALLVEFTMERRVEVPEDDGTLRRILDEALVRVAQKEGKRASDVVPFLGKKVRRRLYERLVSREILRAHRGKVLGMFPAQEWPAEDAPHEDEVRGQVVTAVRNGMAPDERTATLVSLLHALRVVHKAVAPASVGMSRRDLVAAAKRIAEGDWGSEALRRAIDNINAAVVAATATATGASAAGS